MCGILRVHDGHQPLFLVSIFFYLGYMPSCKRTRGDPPGIGTSKRTKLESQTDCLPSRAQGGLKVTLKTSFPPAIHPHVPPHTLILGTCPGDVSLRKVQYFGNDRNTFWSIVGKVLGFDRATLAYEERLQRLGAAGYALWDVLRERQGRGSLDQNTIAGTDQPNDLCKLVQAHPTLRRVCFNSKASAEFFRRHQRNWLCEPGVWALGNTAAINMFRGLVRAPPAYGQGRGLSGANQGSRGFKGHDNTPLPGDPTPVPPALTLLVLDSTSPANAPSVKAREAVGISQTRSFEGIAEYKLFHSPKGCWSACFDRETYLHPSCASAPLT